MWAGAHAKRQEDSMNGTKSKSAVKAAFVAVAMLAAPVALSVAAVSSASASAGQATLMPGEVLYGGQSLVDGPYTMAMQTDGNFVLYANGNQALWQSHTYNNPGSDVVMQTDGNLVVYSPGPTDVHALWQSGTYNQPGDHLAVQTDGNAVIRTPSGQARWATNTSSPYSSSFCSRYGVRYMGTTYNGVAACGNAFPNNNQGEISYNGVEFDSVGFQCVELAARYFYYVTGQHPPLVQDASDYAYYLATDGGYGIYPTGLTGGTSTFQSSLTPGNIISMWSASDQTGHVAVVTNVNVTGGNGTITVMDENAAANGTDTITVSGGKMSYEGMYPDFQWTTNLPG
jgi:surface antigen